MLATDQKKPLRSLNGITAGGESRPVWALFATAVVAAGPSILNAVLFACVLVWVLLDLVVYRIKRGVMPPRPVWGKHNRWTVPLFFGVLAFSAVQAF